jgi:hypothetical protein
MSASVAIASAVALKISRIFRLILQPVEAALNLAKPCLDASLAHCNGSLRLVMFMTALPHGVITGGYCDMVNGRRPKGSFTAALRRIAP